MLSTKNRHLTLAQAALDHALYFLELDAHSKVASYLQYAAEQFCFLAEDNTDMNDADHHLVLSKLTYLLLEFPPDAPSPQHEF